MIRKAFLGIPIVPESAHTLSFHRGIVYKANPSAWLSLSSGRAPWNCALSLLHQHFSLPDSSFPWAYKCLKEVGSLQSYGLQHTGLLYLSLSPGVCSNSKLVMLSNHLILCHPFSFCSPSFSASGSFPVSWLFASGGIGVSASASNKSWFDLLEVQGALKNLLQRSSKASILIT